MKSNKSLVDEPNRRDVIIDALVKNALTKGFHKASMNEVAKTASLSVGQIYRYFAHKDDIICALVERQTQTHLTYLDAFLDQEEWLNTFLETPDKELVDYRIINAEINAEAARNPKIAEICQHSHRVLREQSLTIMKQKYGMSREQAAPKVELLVTLTEGILNRAYLHDAPYSDDFETLMKETLSFIFSNK
ncbi:TetR family transcriptional regulator [Marinomonas mediterranea]|jgi:Transcriptional regulator|uniref:Regulatory protein TetR n=1 Tax=Marinomonas mediterranea (strain ATCC 700492 / JCM 21426 / NBRC 103028 / MMB-1) TaxID=717774 RepID=F2K3V9_MARM1|nr:TetR/AcrR family transcriptional regulator [Marinomonas mediterranea]ADZ90208.1 regulatory protein TetR [Marinomonas mediterranea MMB-1]WCN12330.1 TetR family transcriptional regulator [Marinomonas mediterranea]WCN16406.1 TetR family transcriptional regulator [Marinomonas mediterranea MMB-1]